MLSINLSNYILKFLLREYNLLSKTNPKWIAKLRFSDLAVCGGYELAILEHLLRLPYFSKYVYVLDNGS